MQNHFIIIYEQAYNKFFGWFRTQNFAQNNIVVQFLNQLISFMIHASWMEMWLNDNIKPKY